MQIGRVIGATRVLGKEQGYLGDLYGIYIHDSLGLV